MIIQDESTFSTNNNYQKLWTLKNHAIFCFKRKDKGIMISDFLLSLL